MRFHGLPVRFLVQPARFPVQPARFPVPPLTFPMLVIATNIESVFDGLIYNVTALPKVENLLILCALFIGLLD